MPLIGVVSDTHGSLDGRVLHRFLGVDAILHAGDVGSPDVLLELEAVAPTWAVKGNVDFGSRLEHLPLRIETEVGGIQVLMTHGHLHEDPKTRTDRTLEPSRERIPDLLVLGHSHHPEVFVHATGVLVFNPGSASRPRHGFPRSIGFLETEEGRIVSARVCDLEGNSFLS